jgi:cardiolipin synthase
MFKRAESHIIIMSSYFLPGRAFRKNMANAVKRGVKIQVIAAGPSDVSIAKYAERYLYNWMFRNKIELYEYQPNILHGKMSTYDSKFVTIGSYNVNNISAYASVELNLDIQNESFAGEVEQALKKIMANDCMPVSPKEFKRHNNIIKQFWQRTSYDIIRIIFYLFTFYFKQRS